MQLFPRIDACKCSFARIKIDLKEVAWLENIASFLDRFLRWGGSHQYFHYFHPHPYCFHFLLDKYCFEPRFAPRVGLGQGIPYNFLFCGHTCHIENKYIAYNLEESSSLMTIWEESWFSRSNSTQIRAKRPLPWREVSLSTFIIVLMVEPICFKKLSLKSSRGNQGMRIQTAILWAREAEREKTGDKMLRIWVYLHGLYFLPGTICLQVRLRFPHPKTLHHCYILQRHLAIFSCRIARSSFPP